MKTSFGSAFARWATAPGPRLRPLGFCATVARARERPECLCGFAAQTYSPGRYDPPRASKMLFGEGPTGSRLQIFFECEGPVLVCESDIALDVPGPMLRSVRHRTGIVLRQSGVQIVRDASIEILRVLLALQNVDVFHGEVRLRKEAPARQPSLAHEESGCHAGP